MSKQCFVTIIYSLFLFCCSSGNRTINLFHAPRIWGENCEQLKVNCICWLMKEPSLQQRYINTIAAFWYFGRFHASNCLYYGPTYAVNVNKKEFFYLLKVHDQQRDLQHLHRQLGKAAQECEELSQTSELKGKVVYEENDPWRPRFSLPELRDILQERNALKAKLSDLEDELAVYRPRPPQNM
jgi:hypothetical protein